MSSNNDSVQPPRPNPVLTAYESFVETTPLVTRYLLNSLFCSFILSFFVDQGFAVANIPYFTILRFEIYRPVLCNLVCESLLSLVFICMSFVEIGKRMEYSLGSTAFSCLMFTIAIVTNISFLLFCFVMFFITGNHRELMRGALGVWPVLFGLIAVECAQAPPATTRRFFVFEIPVLYYAVFLLAIFTLFGLFSSSLVLSTGIGYLYGFGYLDVLKLDKSTFLRWEEGCLINFTQRKGWVVGHSATGASAWGLPTSQGGDTQSGSSWTPSSFYRGRPASELNQQASSTSESQFSSPKPSTTTAPFPGSGQSLGTTNRAASGGAGLSDARRAMLDAAERRAEQNSERNHDD
mmetsp:Transcript_7370/g.9521  ORF Transcript_7370/g.9521 Transcript_7370/m.9521 type:complete len:350 (+) Transcript_7370:1320-2369(+)|eukprot:CAMPEP_0116061118 /NCGR_PEP_ID=MMETSP0322-20121206/6874_1 /TAXON_ID=163516 /ORGANISM="Leptocylindrus danicus var. apora, Strain B651" /LENGTH=349 /DNA_ID=CAMNT_0003545975 /DNA_START=1262 /DNA_END=2311 /DNA_ORIENTATION=-